jgi:hypothetical protein
MNEQHQPSRVAVVREEMESLTCRLRLAVPVALYHRKKTSIAAKSVLILKHANDDVKRPSSHPLRLPTCRIRALKIAA